MRADVYTYNSGRLKDHQITGSTVIVVDVLRATTSIITAIKNGADKVVPAQDAGTAAALALRLGDDSVLAGERGGIRLPGFTLGNSPTEFTASAIGGKTVIISTTNGTQAIHGMRSASRLLIGAMINRSAAARLAYEIGNDIIIMCAGTDGEISADDICTAGAMISKLEELGVTNFNDMALISGLAYENWRNGTADIRKARHCRRLIELGFGEDVNFCFRMDTTNTVPECRNGVITKA